MIPMLGDISLLLGLVASFVLLFAKGQKLAKWLVYSIFALCLLSFACLVYSYAISDFSVLNVFQNSHSAKPFIYKISGTWGNHEGSILLLTLILSAYNAAFALFGDIKELTKNKIIRIQGAIIIGFIAFVEFTSNPFVRIFPTPQDGQGLNPLLQDLGLAIHPPMLYLGYIGFALALAFSLAALIEGEANKKWAKTLKNWTLFSWSCLTLGIGLGSWWAYRELGWGGFWFWDPVENSSFIPWLVATALLHSLIVMEKRNSLKIWTILLSIMAFAFSLMGVFLVRSGILTSVHSFASDPTRGVFILAFLAFVIITSLIIFALRADKLKTEHDFAFFSKEGMIVVNNMLLTVSCAVVILGTLYPIFSEILAGVSVSVGAPYFNATFSPIFLPLLVIAAIAPSLKWQKPSDFKALAPFLVPFIIAVVASFFVAYKNAGLLTVVAVGLGAFLLISMIILVIKKITNGKLSKMPYQFHGMVLSHMGVALLVMSVAVVAEFGTEREEMLSVGESLEISDFKVTLENVKVGFGENFVARDNWVSLYDDSENLLAKMNAQVRFYPVKSTTTTESALYYSLLSNVYVAMGEGDGNGAFVMRVYYKPFINLIWFACLMIASGGFVALIGGVKK